MVSRLPVVGVIIMNKSSAVKAVHEYLLVEERKAGESTK